MIRLFLEDKMEAIKVGVIGCGYWGPNLIRNLVDISQAEVVGVSDLRESRLNHIRNLYPRIFTTQNYKDLFSLNLDAVVVATPPATHYAIAKECMENGLNVLIEKPITTNSADAQELVDLAARKDLTLMVGHTFEYNPAVRALKELIDQGEIGQVYYMNSIRVNLGLFQRDLNVLWDLAPHDLSIFLYLLGMRPISVSAQGNDSVFKGIHDLVYLNLVFPNEVFAHIHVSWLDPCKVRRTTVVGSKKMVVYDDVEV